MGAIPGSREPSPSSTGLGPSGFDPERIRELAERCERAAGPDREIDEAILKSAWDCRGKPTDLGPHFTASLDDAMKLVPRGWDTRIDASPSGNWASVGHNRRDLPVIEVELICSRGRCATPALAVCAAAVRAHAASADTHRNGGDAEQAPGDSLSGAVPKGDAR